MSCILDTKSFSSIAAAVILAAGCQDSEADFVIMGQDRAITLDLGEARVQEFEVRSDCAQELIFSGPVSSCTCMYAAVPEVHVPPYGRAAIPVKLEGKLLGTQSSRVQFRVNSPLQPTAEIRIQLIVGGGLMVEPRELSVSLDKNTPTEVAKAIVVVPLNHACPVLSVESEVKGINFILGPLVERELDSATLQYDSTISAVASDGAQSGFVQGRLVVRARNLAGKPMEVERTVMATIRREI